MGWLFVIPVFIFAAIAMIVYLNSWRMLSRYHLLLEKNRRQLDQLFHKRRNLLPSLIALGASVPGVEHECLETLDNAAELVIRSKGLDERLVSENRLSSALHHVRSRLEGKAAGTFPNMKALVDELDVHESGLAIAAEQYNRHLRDLMDCLSKIPHRWTCALCGYHPPHNIEIRLSTSPQQSNRMR